ncbi:MAG: hypothetical protein KKD05_03895 [Candidatus Omnitrophica bacterium]|nr:hypothetical protein [Candidatus Omnitrophota bacterium]
MKKKNIVISIMVMGFMLISCFNAISGIEDDKIQQIANKLKPELNTANSTEAKVVSTTPDDISLSSTPKSNQSTTLTPIQTATSVASGLIASGTTDKSVVKATLISYGYEETEAEIAYVKASTSDILAETPKKSSNNNIETKTLDAKPTMLATDRVAQTVKTSPVMKFRNLFNKASNKVTQNEKDTVTQMIDEGYSIGQIAEGFAGNKYNSSQTAAIFKEAGVSSMDAYDALSGIAVKKAEASEGKLMSKLTGKPREKFAKRLGLNTPEQQKQEAIKTTVNELQAAGYDVHGILDSAVQDLKDAGMSAQGVKDFMISKVADGKPSLKFRSGKGFISNIILKVAHNWAIKKSKMASYGDGETGLATAMIKAGYSGSEVSAAFKTGPYSYTNADTQKIVSTAETNISNQAAANLTPASPDNKIHNTQEDVLQRNTQSIPI